MKESTFALFFENDLKVVLPELYLLLASVGLLIYGAYYSKVSVLSCKRSRNEVSDDSPATTLSDWGIKRTKCVTPPLLSEPSNKLAALVLVFSAMLLWQNPVEHASIFYNSMVLDAFGRVCKLLMLSAALLCMLISIDYLRRQVNAFEYSFLLLFATGGGMFLISSADLLSMFLSLEFQSLCFYVLAALKRNSEFATEAGLKYLVLGAFSSGVLLFGCSLLYGFTGATHLTELAKLFSCGTNSAYFLGALTGMLFIAVGLLFKLSAAPFHSWAPDVYDGSPSPVTTFFAAAPKISVFAFLIRLLQAGFNDLNALVLADWSSQTVLFQSGDLYETPPFQKILLFCCMTSMILGALGAMQQRKIKRLLAYAAISHVGFLLIGLCSATAEGFQALFFNLVIYIIMTINAFAIILCPVRRDFMSTYQQIKFISDLSVLIKTNPIIAATLTLNLFSMAGIPPLAGFLGKYFLLLSAFNSQLYLVALVGAFTTVLSSVYYIRLIHLAFFERRKKSRLIWPTIQKTIALTLAATTLIITLLVYYPRPLFLFLIHANVLLFT